jgi:hypothetical protein
VWTVIILAEGGVGVGFPFFSRHERITVQLIVEPNAVSKGKEAHVPHFTEDSLRRIIINPIYTITVAPQLTEEHEPAMDETEWVRTNVTLIGEMGAASWLRQLLDILESKAGVQEEPINPFQAMNIDPLFATPHPALIEREMWVDANVMHIRDMGAEGWLRQLLDVLDGDIVTAEEVDLSPPSNHLGYAGSARTHPQRRGKKKQKKRRRQ